MSTVISGFDRSVGVRSFSGVLETTHSERQSSNNCYMIITKMIKPHQERNSFRLDQQFVTSHHSAFVSMISSWVAIGFDYVSCIRTVKFGIQKNSSSAMLQ